MHTRAFLVPFALLATAALAGCAADEPDPEPVDTTALQDKTGDSADPDIDLIGASFNYAATDDLTIQVEFTDDISRRFDDGARVLISMTGADERNGESTGECYLEWDGGASTVMADSDGSRGASSCVAKVDAVDKVVTFVLDPELDTAWLQVQPIEVRGPKNPIDEFSGPPQWIQAGS